MIQIAWPVTEAEKKKKKDPGADAPLSKDDKKFIKEHTTKKDDKKKSDGESNDDFNSKHPRAPAGSAAGGEFALSDGGSGEDSEDKNTKGKGKPKLGEHVQRSGGGLAFKAGYGKKGGDARVKGLQSQLNKMGLTDASGKPLAVDGMLGPKTTAAIKKAQKRLGMKPTGKADAAFLSKFKAGSKLTDGGKPKPKTKTKPGGGGKLTEMNGKPSAKKPPVKKPAAKAQRPGTRKNMYEAAPLYRRIPCQTR
jgi:hypothetical protein